MRLRGSEQPRSPRTSLPTLLQRLRVATVERTHVGRARARRVDPGMILGVWLCGRKPLQWPQAVLYAANLLIRLLVVGVVSRLKAVAGRFQPIV